MGGNKYIMHATSAECEEGVACGNPLTPDDWVRKDEIELVEDLVLTPDPVDSTTKKPKAGGRDKMGDISCGFTLIMDSQGNGFHRYTDPVDMTALKNKLNYVLDKKTPSEFAQDKKQQLITIGIVVAVILLLGCSGGICYWRSGTEDQTADDGVELGSS